MPGRPCKAAGSLWGRGASGGSRLQLEKSGGVRPGRGTTYPGIPATEVLGVVTPPEGVVIPYPGVCSTIWLHDAGGTGWGLPHTCTGGLGCSSNGKILLRWTLLAAGVGPQLGGPYHGPDWVAAPAGLLPHLGLRQPNLTN